MTEKERLRNWLDCQITAKNSRYIETDGGVQIATMDLTHVSNELFVYNAAELARILDEVLHIEPRDGVEMKKRVYFTYRGYKVFDIFNA